LIFAVKFANATPPKTFKDLFGLSGITHFNLDLLGYLNFSFPDKINLVGEIIFLIDDLIMLEIFESEMVVKLIEHRFIPL
jgi:hypothetical protein